MENLFDIPDEQWELDKKVRKLRKKIADKALELNIVPEHDDTGHYYRFGDKKYFSVTGWLQILKDPGIMNWKMNRACEYILKNFHRTDPTILDEQWIKMEDLIEEAKLVPAKEFEGAGSIGTAVHNWREGWFQKMIDEDNPNVHRIIDHSQDSRIISGCRAIEKFVKECNYKPVACELYVADHKLETGGQVDDIGFVNGELALVDLKTSNIGDKESYFAQVALYYSMFSKLYGIRPKKLYILHVSKTDGTYKLINIPDIPGTVKWARKVVDVSKGLQLIKAAKKKQVNYL